MGHPQFDAAVPAGVDPEQHARLLRRVHDASMAGHRPPARPRPVIEDSWARTRRLGVDPDGGPPPRVLGDGELRRHRDASPVAEVLEVLRGSLVPVAEQAGHVMVVADAAGHVLWREGARRTRRLGDSAGLVEGSYWDEASAGTNAIGTALAVNGPVQVHSAEHFVRGLHALTCACAPLRDPRDGRLLGAVNVTGPVSTVHPSTLALVSAVAHLAEAHLRGVHHERLERLRSVASPLLAGLKGPALVVDEDGWTAAATRMDPVRRLPLPARGRAGTVWLPALGECVAEPLPGGWLVRPRADEGPPASRLVLDLRRPSSAVLTVSGPSGEWAHGLTPRHAELLFLLARRREGSTAVQLARDVFGRDRAVTVRAELSRLRRHLGGILESRPYRFAEGLRVRVLHPDRAEDLLPASSAPGVRRAREEMASAPEG